MKIVLQKKKLYKVLWVSYRHQDDTEKEFELVTCKAK